MARSAHAVANVLSGNPYINALTDDVSHWQSTTVEGEPQRIGLFISDEREAWTPAERLDFLYALGQWANVANITFDLVGNRADANLVETKAGDTSPTADLAVHDFPNSSDVAVGWFNSAAASYTAAGSLAYGGDGFYTFVHELGHALGLTHPHDGRVFAGVDGRDATGATVDFDGDGVLFERNGSRDRGDITADVGEHGLNQGVFSVMSYNATYNNFPGVGGDFAWGRPMGPMAFDIAAIQELYGPNPGTATGNDTYVLPDANAAGTGWSCIWDAGGVSDQIVYNGTRNATIDLRAATLRNEEGGGGWLSHADGIAGGVTIAHGVLIENATGGNGADTITGNESGNRLNGRGGSDTIHGNGGDDTLYGGDGVDYLCGDAGVDTLHGGANGDTLHGGGDGDTLYGDAGVDTLYGDFGSDTLYGGADADTLYGGWDADELYGGRGKDTLWGGNGDDTFHFTAAADSPVGVAWRDVIMDFQSGRDRIDLSALDPNPVFPGNQTFTLVGSTPGIKGGNLWLTSGTDMVLVEGDVTGDGRADFQIEVRSVTTLSAGDFIL